MMNQMMSGSMMPDLSLLWILIGILVGIMLAVLFNALLARRRNEQTLFQAEHGPQSQGISHDYTQGYQPLQETPETYQENEQQFRYPQYEEPAAQYPPVMPRQQ
jgi:hypothetical protein